MERTFRSVTYSVRRPLLFVTAVVISAVASFCGLHTASADPYPPVWGGGTGPSVHSIPVPWPSEPANPLDCGETCGDWIPYPYFQVSAKDPRIQDPSNGGTSPQNYVNISSSCVDQGKPSVYYNLDTAHQVLLFRWRVEQIANNYATGPTPGSFGATSPWNSGLWTVFFDIDGDGYRDLAAHLNGSSGDPSTAVDRLVGIWGNVPSNQSLDYPNDPNIHLLGHNPTGFIDAASSRLLNFRSSVAATTQWPNGAAERTWDYGTTRSRLITKANADGATCDEYFVDYQIPLAMLDASSLGGPAIEPNLPLAMLFCTANSLNNPFQKDCLYQGAWIGDPTKPAPFGDYMTFSGEKIAQPIVDDITAAGCGPVTLNAAVKDTLYVANGATAPSIASVDFYAYADTNSDGVANDGSTWELAAIGERKGLNRWTAQWSNASPVMTGAYLIGVQALDMGSKNPGGTANRTISYLAPAEVSGLTPPGGESWWANPPVTGAKSVAFDVNTCGAPPPYVTKSASAAAVVAGASVQFTITVHNTRATPLSVNALSDQLPPGFVYVSTDSNTLSAQITPPTVGATGAITWSVATPESIPGGTTRELVFTATAASTTGTYNNTAAAATGEGVLTSEPVAIDVGAPRLTLSKSASTASLAPGSVVTYTIAYANNSPVNVTGARITDTVPLGLGSIIPLENGTYNPAAREIVWDAGVLAAGEGPYSVRFVATVDAPYAGAQPLVNSATIASEQTAPASATSSTYVVNPRPQLVLQKTVNPAFVAEGANATFTLRYENIGTAAAAGVVITDPIPAGFTYVSATAGGSSTGGAVQWSIGTVAVGATGSVQLVLKAASPYTAPNPQTNTGWISAPQASTASATTVVGVKTAAAACTTFYFHDDTANVGNAGVHKLALTEAPAPADAATGTRVTVPGSSSAYSEVVRFYQEPAAASDILLSGLITTSFYIDRENGPGLLIKATVYEYDSVSGETASLGQSVSEFLGSERGLLEFEVNGQGTLQAGHRLLWVFEARSKTSQTVDVLFQYGGTVPNSVSDTTEPIATTFAFSHSKLCPASPPRLLVDKQVDKPVAGAGDSVGYTIQFANAGGTAAINAEITDTLPVSMTFQNATLNGAAVGGPLRSQGQAYTFAVNSLGQPAGTIAAGMGGTLIITGTLAAPLPPAMMTLHNQAVIGVAGLAPVTATVASNIMHPLLTIAKRADKATLKPGERLTYTMLVQNAGSYTATNVLLSDTLPVQPYFTYVANSTKVNNAAVADAVTAGQLNLNLGTLPPGGTALVSLQMEVASSGVPDGLGVLDNRATVASTQTPAATSEVVSVAIDANPRLALDKTVDRSTGLTASDMLTYTLIVTNTGSGDALNVQVSDRLPLHTRYVNGSLRYGDAARTDAADADEAQFDAVTNSVRFAAGTLPQGEMRRMTFQVQLDAELPNGATLVDNEAAAVAANASTVKARARAEASAAPVLTIDKRGPAVVAWPAATVSAPASGTTFAVSSAKELAVGQHVLVGGQQLRITAIAGLQVTVDGNVTVAAGDRVGAGIVYAIHYGNHGTAAATNVKINDTLPAGLTQAAATPLASVNGSNLTWDVGALGVGATGDIEVVVFPTEPGVLVNSAAIESDQTEPVTATATTAVGGLVVYKRTTTPSVVLTQSGAPAMYVIEVQNTLATPVTGVIVTDTLPAGFVYNGTAAITGGTRTANAPQPHAGSAQPVWGTFSIPANGTLAINFVADVLPTAGPGVHQNAVAVAAARTATVPFDELATTAEDVEVLVTTLAAGGEVDHFVWLDANGDGLQDKDEGGVPGVTAYLLDANGSVVRVAMTDAGGWCVFDKLSPGTYAVQTSLPPLYGFTVQDVMAGGADFADSDADPANGKAATFILASGENYPTSAAGLTLVTAAAGIEGRAWYDRNSNGVQDAGESGVSGVTVMLLRADNTPAGTVQTDAAGRYWLYNLAPGNYSVQFVAPKTYGFSVRDAGGDDLADSDVDPVSGATTAMDLGAGQHARGWDAGLTLAAAPVRLNGSAWIDANSNGMQDGDEPRLPGVEVKLLHASGEPIVTAKTMTNGEYLFDNLAPTSYSLEFALPDGYVRTQQDQGSDDALDSDGTQDTGRTGVYAPPAGGTETTGDAGFVPLLTAGGAVFNDFRNDGIYDASEDFGVSGVQVNTYWDADGNGELSAADGVPVAVATTAVGGEYRFAGLPAGDYIIELDAKNFAETGLLARFVSSLKGTAQRPEPQVDPDDDKDSDDNGYNSSRNGDANVISRAVTLSAGAEPANDGDANASSNLTLDFGVYDPSVGDSVWWDADRDGVQDPGEPGLANVAVNLYADSNGDGELDAGDALRRQATSGSAGDYTFAFLPPGEYLAHVPAQNFAPGGPLEQWNASPGGGDPDDDNNTDSNGAASPMGGISASALTLTSSGEPTNDGDGDEYTNLSLDFGFWPSPAEINGYAWRDSNGDGIQNLGEVPVAGITVTLYSAANELVAATGTGGDGRYRFDALAPGSYYIVFSPPDRFRITAAHSGSDDAIDSDAEAGGQTASIRLTAGREEGHWDIGLLAPTDENERPEPELVPKIFLPVVNR